MARLRSLNAQQCIDDDLLMVSLHARFAFAFLPCFADRDGRLEDKPRALKASILPDESVDMNVLLDELARGGFIQRYESGGRRYINIKAFRRHQSPHRNEALSKIPPPPEVCTVVPPAHTESGNFASDSGNYAKFPEPLGELRVISLPSGSGSGSGLGSGSELGPNRGPDLPPACDLSAPVQDVVVPDETEEDPDALEPDTGYGIIHRLRVAIERARPELSFWQPGSFGEREADQLAASLPKQGPRRPVAVDRLRERIDEFATDPAVTDLSVKGFRAWLNRIRGPTAAGGPVRSEKEKNTLAAGENWLASGKDFP